VTSNLGFVLEQQHRLPHLGQQFLVGKLLKLLLRVRRNVRYCPVDRYRFRFVGQFEYGPIGGFFADRQPRSAHFFPRGYDKTQIHRDCRSVAFFRFRNKPSAELHHHCMRFRIDRNHSLAPFRYALLYESVSRTSPADLVHLVDPQRLPVPPSQPHPEDPYLPLRLVGLRVLSHP
jgi:hypothetical protein